MAKAKWLNWAIGEMSKLRDLFSLTGWSLYSGTYTSPYRLDSSHVDYAKARALYENTDDAYKLGAGFAKTIVNTPVGFMGVPAFRSEDENAQEVLDSFFGANVSRMQQVHRNAMRDGDCYVWITREEIEDVALYPEAKTRLNFNIIPPEQVVQIIRSPITGHAVEYVLKSKHEWLDESGNRRQAIITQRINNKQRVVQISGDIPPDMQSGVEVNNWGFIPIVHFRNEGDETREFGISDLEAIEPFLKAYHDVMLHAMQGSKMHSTPRLKLKLKDVARFLQNNFGITDPAEFAAKGGTINLDGHELLIFQDEEDAGFIEVNSAIGDAKDLLQLLFYCIVDTSETPEFAFGVHTPSSLSSVKEQMPILVRRIARKREHFTESWQRLARIVLAMTSQAEGKRFSTYATTLEWDDIDPRDGKDVAEELQLITSALNTAVQGGFLSIQSATDFLKEYITTMHGFISDDPEVPGERERIIQDKILQARLEDTQGLLDEQQAISQIEEGTSK
jgi:hypothetical protein